MNRAEIVLGCRMRDIARSYVYGNCMRGWIHSIRLENIADYANDAALSASHICSDTDCNLCAELYSSGCFET